MFKLLDTVVLKRNLPEAGLLEFVAASGRTQALITLRSDDMRHVNDRDLIAVRSLQQAVG